MPSEIYVTPVNGGTLTTMAFIGGSGLPTNPYEWRITNGDPLFAQMTMHTYRRSVGKDVDQLVLKFTIPYKVTDSTTTVVSSPSRAESTVTFNLPRTVPQSTIDAVVNLTSNAIFLTGTPNLRPALEARQAG